MPIAMRAPLLTYEEAARTLGIQVNTVKQLVYRRVLFPERVSGSTQKYLSREQVEWYARRRAGEDVGPNPYVEALSASAAEADLNAINASRSQQALASADIPKEYGGLALFFLVVALLLAIIANKQPD